jgi:YbbR domain-containing protein
VIREMLTSNIWLKIASLVLAFILWFFVVMSVHTDIIIDVPVKFINRPPDMEMMDGGRTVRLGIEGQERVLTALSQNDISVVIDLGEAKAGKNFFSLSREDISMPGMLKLKSISPQTLSLVLEERLKKAVSVKPVVVGLPDEGYSVDGIIINPERVIVEGPESLIKRIKSVKTEPIDVTGICESLRVSALLDITEPNLTTDIREVEITIAVKKTR